jgi:hypothetical protein
MTNCCLYTSVDLCVHGALNLHYIISFRVASLHTGFSNLSILPLSLGYASSYDSQDQHLDPQPRTMNSSDSSKIP